MRKNARDSMTVHQHKITLISSGKPLKRSLNEELRWFGVSLGLFGQRDRDKSCFRLFIELLKNAKENKTATSDELSYKTNLSRGTAVHHLNRLMESGIVKKEGKKYLLRVQNLTILVEEIQSDIKRACEDLKEVAKEIDTLLRL